MRSRLLVVLSLLSLVAIAGFALPLLVATAAARTQQFVVSRSADLEQFSAYAQQAIGTDATAVLIQEIEAHSRLYDEGVVVVDGGRHPVVESAMRAADPDVASAIDAALRNQPPPLPERLTPWSTRAVLLWRPVGTGTLVGGAVVLRASPAAAARDISRGWTIVLLGAATAAAAFVLLAVVVARWVLRPVRELVGGVGEIAAGRPGAHVSPSAGPPELRDLASAFNRMSDAVRTSAEQQRRLVADTSHQLRNPLAALRLRLDSIDDEVGEPARHAYHSAVKEMDRLEVLLDGLLHLASAESRAMERAAGDHDDNADVATVIADRVDAWTPAADDAEVGLRLRAGPVATAVCSTADLAQVLDVLLDNAIAYAGRGAVVTTGWTAGADRVRIEVCDSGHGIPEADLGSATQRFWRGSHERRGSGLGLAIAHQLVSARDGELTVDRADEGGVRVTVDLRCR